MEKARGRKKGREVEEGRKGRREVEEGEGMGRGR